MSEAAGSASGTPGAAGPEALQGGASQAVELVERSPGHFQIRGALTFATARGARELGLTSLRGGGPALEVDCGGITVSDSAGMTVLLDWLAAVKRSGQSLRFTDLPAQLQALARISDVLPLLERGV